LDEMCREESIGCVHHYTVNPKAPPTVPALPSLPSKKSQNGGARRQNGGARRRNGGARRQAKSNERKERLKKALVELSEIRETRLPVSGLELWTEGKWLQYMVGTLETDDEHFEKEMTTVQTILREVYELVDHPLDGAGDGKVKRDYMKPILSPVIYDLAVNALRTDWAFVNATFHKKIFSDKGSEKMQQKRATKIVTRLDEEAGGWTNRMLVVKQLIRHVDGNPESWYNKKVPSLKGTNMVKFLRSTTKSYVRKALEGIPEDDIQQIRDALYVAAVIDASLSGKAIQKRVSETAAVGTLNGALYNVNPTELEIVEHYKHFLKEQKTEQQTEQQTEARLNAINRLLVATDDRPDKLVHDVRLLWSIYDEDSENAFSESERDRYTGLAARFLGQILSPYREKIAGYEGKEEGMEWLNNLLHAWANKLLVAIFVVVAGIRKLGCPICRRGCSGKTCSTKAKKKEAPSKDKITKMEVYRIGHLDLLWIKEENMYKRISNRGHPDYYARIWKQQSVARTTQALLVGEIDANGNVILYDL
jgi:hypothetical protein